MNSKNLTVAKLRRLLLVTALVLTPLLAIQSANAQAPVATATLTSGGSNSITITNNQSFTMTLAISTNFTASGYTVFYQMTSGGQFFQLTGRTNLNTFMTDPTTSDAVAFGGNAGRFQFGPTMNSNQFDLGYTSDQVNNQPPGSNIQLQTINVSALNAPNGTYTIQLDPRSIVTQAGTFTDAPMSAQLTVTVIPEPSTIGLAVLGGAGLLLMLRRKRSQA